MKNVLLTSTAIALVSGGAASAADLPLKAARPAAMYVAPTWEGFYLGAHVGVGRMNSSMSNVTTGGGSPGMFGVCNYGASCVGSASGVVGGVEAGYDWQRGTFVYGIAADWTWTDLKHKRTGKFPPADVGSTYNIESKIDWMASFRGRMGLAVQDTMVYVTGGLALAKVKADYSMSADDFYPYGSLSKTKIGWVAGGGIEHRLSRNWSFKAEALYYDFGSDDTTTYSPVATGTYTNNFSREVIVGRVGLNYRF